MPTLIGTDNDDTITGTGNDIIDARGGNDVIRVGPGRSVVSAGDGDDRVIVSDVVLNSGGQTVADSIDGGAGFDIFDASLLAGFNVNWTIDAGTGAVNVNRMNFSGGLQVVGGTTSTTGFERFIGGFLANNFNFTGLARSVEIVGGVFNDVIIGGSAADILRGGAGHDRITIGAGDTIFGDDGDDTFLITSNSQTLLPTTVNGGAGVDTLSIDLLTGGAITVSNAGGVMHFGGVSLTSVENITVIYNSPQVGVSVNLTGGDEANRLIVEDSGNASNPIRVDIFGGGGAGNDSTYGSGILNGDDGDDFLFASDFGNLYGGRGNDELRGGVLMDGGEGDDLMLVTSPGFATADGGSGIDTLNFANLPGFSNSVQANLTTGQISFSGQTATVTGVERLIGTQYNDTLIGDGAANVLSGGNGDDTLSGGRRR